MNSFVMMDQSMFGVICRFRGCQRGGISLDWIGLVAGIMLLGMMLVHGLFNNGVSSTSKAINENLRKASTVIDVDPRPSPGIYQ